MLKRIFLSMTAFLLLATGQLYGAEADQDDAFDLGDIVVTSRKVGIADIGISQAVTVDDIKATNSKKPFADALKICFPVLFVTRGRKKTNRKIFHPRIWPGKEASS